MSPRMGRLIKVSGSRSALEAAAPSLGLARDVGGLWVRWGGGRNLWPELCTGLSAAGI